MNSITVANTRCQVLTVSLSIVPLFVLFAIVPESPLWLRSKGRLKEAQRVLRCIAKVNKKDPSVIVLVDESSHDWFSSRAPSGTVFGDSSSLTSFTEDTEGTTIWFRDVTVVF